MSNLPVEKLKVGGKTYDIFPFDDEAFVCQIDDRFYVAKNHNDLPEGYYYGNDYASGDIVIVTFNDGFPKIDTSTETPLCNTKYSINETPESEITLYSTYEDAKANTNPLPFCSITLTDSEGSHLITFMAEKGKPLMDAITISYDIEGDYWINPVFKYSGFSNQHLEPDDIQSFYDIDLRYSGYEFNIKYNDIISKNRELGGTPIPEDEL